MVFLRPLLIFFILLCTLLTQAFAGEKQDRVYRSFWHPNYHGQRLNYCSLEHHSCGKAIADQYCKKLGYDYANQEIPAPNVGLTHFINSSAKCVGWRCDGFMTIDCVKYMSHKPAKSYHYSESMFVYPRMHHYRVDWCYKKNKDCGARAADAFCMHKGFMQAKRFRQQTKIQATATIGSQALCFGKECKAFKYIICSR